MSQAQNVARQRKYADELTAPVTVRLPVSVKAYLAKSGESAGMQAYEVIMFEKDLTEQLADVLQDLRISAALQNQGYDVDRAETIARLVKLGLKAEKSRK